MRNEGSIALELDVSTVSRLLRTKAVTVEDIYGIDASGKRRLRRLLLELLSHELTRSNKFIN